MKLVEVIHVGHEQSVHLPADCHLEATQVYVKRVGRAVMLIPKDEDLWRIFENSLDEFTEDFMLDRSQPTETERRERFE